MTQYNPEELARKLDQIFPAGKRSVRERGVFDDPALHAAAVLTRTGAPTLSPQASARIQAAVVRAHKARFTRRRDVQRTFWGWAAAAAVFIAVMVGGVVPAAAGSVPGDLFYPVKQTIERVELTLAAAPAARAETYLHHADRRVNEAQILSTRGLDITSLTAAAEGNLAAAAAAAAGDASLLARTAQRADEIEQRLAALEEPAIVPITSTATPTATFTPMPTETPDTPEAAPTASATLVATPMMIQPPTAVEQQAEQSSNCEDRGNSCNSQGVPGGQIDPANPPGQTGGRSDTNPGQGGGNGNGRGN